MSQFRRESEVVPPGPRAGRLTRLAGWATALVALVVLLSAFQSATGRPELVSAAAGPAGVTLTFSDPVDPAHAHLSVTAEDGTDVAAGAVRASGTTVVRPVRPSTGGYLVTFSALVDGTEVAGTSRVGAAGPAQPEAAGAAPGHQHDPSGAATVLPLAVVTVVLVVAVSGYVRARRRQRRLHAG